ncbi:MAG: TolC family protein [Gemmatimonadota bacterium]
MMFGRRGAVVVALGLAALGAAGPARLALAQSTGADGELGLVEAVERALGQYPTLGAAAAVADAARARHAQAKADWWPLVGLSGSITRYSDPMVVSPIHGFDPGVAPEFDESLIQGGAFATWTLFDGGGRGARIGLTRWEASAAEVEVDGAAQALIADVSASYLETLSRAAVLAAHDRRIAALETERDRVERLREVGRAAEIEILRVEAVMASATADRIGVAADLDVARRELARLVGAAPSEPGERGLVPVQLARGERPDREAVRASAVTSSPAVEGARRRRESAEAGRSLARSERWPELQAFGNWIDYGGLDSDHRLEWAAGLRVSVPLFTGGRVGREVERADADARGAVERLRLAVTETERAVDRAVSAVEETEARVRSLETAAARAAEVARIEVLRLEAGAGTQTDYLDAEASRLAAEAALAETRHAAIQARVELARIVGRLGPEWLEENLEMAP